ncbi:hypothetical protein GUJ93_ZPchr0006g44609 [Zizania palustris]|uniref:Uncharacterized protein n=1 Tax=Zizania palustris TaxID=103762 RepID=A0A8J5T5E5_ZIZPA|nr:hypothetical protein GUJ93_ZPchr0006g44609 [Zizania palustris]
MEEDPLIPLVHVWNNAAYDGSLPSSSAWHPQSPAVAAVRKGDKENNRPEPDDGGSDVEAEIDHIEAEILRLSSRLHHLRCSQQSEPNRNAAPTGEVVAKVRPRPRGLSLGPLDVIALVNPEKQPPRTGQSLKPIRQHPAPRGRGLSLGPLEIAAANPKVPAAQHQQQHGAGAARILKPIKEPPVQRRRTVSLGPMEIHHSVGGKPAAARVKPLPSKLNAIREEGRVSKKPAVPAKPWPSSNTKETLESKQGAAASRAKARSTSPRSRRQWQSIAKVTDSRGGNKVVDELKPKVVLSQTGGATAAAVGRKPAGSSKMRVVPSRYSLTPGASLLGGGTQERRRKQSLPGSAVDASQSEEIRAKVIESSNDPLSPQTIAKVAEMLPRIRTMPPFDESPRDSGCAKRVADLAGKRSFFTAAAEDGDGIPSYQARVLEVEAPNEAAAEA